MNRELIDEFAAARGVPATALARAVANPDEIGDVVLGILSLAAAGARIDERQESILFWGLHVLGAVRDTRGFPSLMRLLRRPGDELDVILGDALTLTIPRVVAGMYDGNTALFHEALMDRNADGFVRHALFGTLAFLTAAGRIARTETSDLLVRFDEERAAQEEDAAWMGWADAVALLGLHELAGRVGAAREDGRLLGDEDDPLWFAETLARAEIEPGDLSQFAENQLGYIEDLADELAWVEEDPGEDDDGYVVEEPVRNPLRHVGRNDPCPCGSGKKFKKCCLGK